MVGMKVGDPHAIVMQLITTYVEKQLRNPVVPKAAEIMGHYMLGTKIARQYRMDVPEPARNILSREYLRGAIADFKVG